VQLHLVDHSRRDPWVPSRPRELMVSLWYPGRRDDRFGFAPWIPHRAGKLFLDQLISSLPVDGRTPTPQQEAHHIPLPGVGLPITAGRLGTPVLPSGHPYPIVLYQPGYGDVRELGTGLVSDLASRGYVVVTMDDTYEAEVVEFPGGRIVTPRPNQSHVDSVRIADTRFVLDELRRLHSGFNPDAQQRPLPRGLGEALEPRKVGMFGHSLGGATAAKAMAADSRIHAGLNLDGSILLADPAKHQNIKQLAARVGRAVGERPFMLMTSWGHTFQTDPSLAGFWSGLRGWRLAVTMKNSDHYTYTDMEEFLSQLLAAGVAPHHLTSAVVADVIGTVRSRQAVAAERAYIAAFFDAHLRGRPSELLKGPSARYPEIEFFGG
jgi:dienelactone hydrolase